MVDRFRELISEIEELHDRKAADYADRGDPFQNFRACEVLGVTPYVGVLIRMADKLSRVNNLVTREARVSEESVVDTLKDLAVYSLIAVCLYEERPTRELEAYERYFEEVINFDPIDDGCYA